MINNSFLGFLYLLIGLIFASCGKSQSYNNLRDMDTNYIQGAINAPEFPAYAEWLNSDKPIKMADLRGKIVLLDFWTYCCINCMHILPDLHRLEKKYPALVVIGVHSAKFTNESDTRNIREAILRYDIEHPVINDFRFELWDQYAVRAWPSFILIDPTGKIVGSTSGEGIYEALDGLLSELIIYWKGKGLLKEERMQFTLESDIYAHDHILRFPAKIVADSINNRLFISDSNNDRILIIDPTGQVIDSIGSGITGKQDGSFSTATFYRPMGMAYDAVENRLFIADLENHTIRLANFNNRTVTTIAGTGSQANGRIGSGIAKQMALNSPWDLEWNNGKLFIAMAGSHQIFTFDMANGILSPFAGNGRENIVDGMALDACLAQPSGLSYFNDKLYFADSEVSAIRVIENGRVKTLSGRGLFDFGDSDGDASVALLQHPLGVLFSEGILYIADTYNNRIKVWDFEDGTMRTIAGNGLSGNIDGRSQDASFNEPNDIAMLNGKLYITDTNNHIIRCFDIKTGMVSTLELFH